jgi:sigma-E factor negative regulatory protein RseA
MSKESLEHLSSLMDGEISREAGLFLTRRLSSDESMCETWERYHLIRDCIRQPGSKHVVTGLAIKLKEPLEAEEQPVVTQWISKRWLKPVSGLAIAASVAMMAIVVTAPEPGDLQATGETAEAPVIQPFVSPNTLARTPSQAASFAPGQTTNTNQLNAYLLRHNQMARTAGRQGFVSFVPIVATTVVAEPGKSENSMAEDTESRTESAENQ